MEVQDGSTTMYYFPQKKFGKTNNFTTEQAISRTRATSGEAFGAISKMMSSLGWNLKSSQKQMEASSYVYVCVCMQCVY